MPAFWTIFVLTSGHTWRATIAQWIRLAFHPATPGSTLLHTIYAFIICSQICDKLVLSMWEKNENLVTLTCCGVVVAWPVFESDFNFKEIANSSNYFSQIRQKLFSSNILSNVVGNNFRTRQWWWLSWKSGCYQYQRSAVRIQSSAKIYFEHLLSTVMKRWK